MGWELHIVKAGVDNWVSCGVGSVQDAIKYFVRQGWTVLRAKQLRGEK